MHQVRQAIVQDEYPHFLKRYFKQIYKTKDKYPTWAVTALKGVGVDLLTDEDL